jgi:hypothetical protein
VLTDPSGGVELLPSSEDNVVRLDMFARVANTTEEDWQDVQLNLIANELVLVRLELLYYSNHSIIPIMVLEFQTRFKRINFKFYILISSEHYSSIIDTVPLKDIKKRKLRIY